MPLMMPPSPFPVLIVPLGLECIVRLLRVDVLTTIANASPLKHAIILWRRRIPLPGRPAASHLRLSARHEGSSVPPADSGGWRGPSFAESRLMIALKGLRVSAAVAAVRSSAELGCLGSCPSSRYRTQPAADDTRRMRSTQEAGSSEVSSIALHVLCIRSAWCSLIAIDLGSVRILWFSTPQ